MTLKFPPVYILDFKIELDELHEMEEEIESNVYDIKEAEVVLGKVTQKKRVEHELRRRGLIIEEIAGKVASPKSERVRKLTPTRHNLKRKRSQKADQGQEVIIIDSSTESDDERSQTGLRVREKPGSTSLMSLSRTEKLESSHSVTGSLTPSLEDQDGMEADTIKVVNISWYYDSKQAGEVLPIGNYLIYEGRKIEVPRTAGPTLGRGRTPRPEEILHRAQNEASHRASNPAQEGGHNGKSSSANPAAQVRQRPALLTETTSEHDIISHLPPVPLYLHSRYSCQRPTLLHSPNEEFLDQLKQIKRARVLTSDEISVRAYSSAIGTLASYPYTLTTVHEVHALPGCGEKVAKLYQEWRETGHLEELDGIETSSMLQTLRLFYNIYGVAAITAREFYHRGWRDLDDVVLNWSSLSREQQIGLKFYDDFQARIPRAEVEKIAAVILQYANKFQDGFQMCIVGGYRRGQETSGDVDVILTHPDEEATMDLINPLVKELEEDGWVTHSLKVTTRNSQRHQQPVGWKGEGHPKKGGFDTLDSAFLAWQDPEWEGMEADLKRDPKAKNPNLHRRVDIIISPWKTAGCAILGWSGGTTFERDLRWYCKNELGLKFDSSGIRNRKDGTWIDVERDETDLLRKEKSIFEFLKLEWREPTERCTG